MRDTHIYQHTVYTGHSSYYVEYSTVSAVLDTLILGRADIIFGGAGGVVPRFQLIIQTLAYFVSVFVQSLANI